MIRRLFYHGFWNFYDHMGTLVLWGTGHALVALGLAVVSISLIGDQGQMWPVTIILALLQFILLVVVLSALLPYCARAARGEPARFRHLIRGIKTYWTIVARILGVTVFLSAILAVNLNFYILMQGRVSSSGIKLLLVFIVAIIGWTCLFMYMFLGPWLCAATAGKDKITARNAFKRALMAVALVPGAWIVLGLSGLLLSGVGLYTRVGLIFLVPVMASFSQTAFQLAAQYADFLAASKEELGAGFSLREYKRRASELGWEWEYRQPRRTFKELIRPWEY